ncbi:extracellular solute-binding protein [Streptomyces sp. NPDC048110]|uniref:ABC transporter substrate-binding protein n=1 Tax=Streptomyces sp. NPDC048110 TaxID=3155483 RepID=UPI0033CB2CF4
MRNFARVLATSAALALAAASLAACGADANNGGSDGQTTISYFSWNNEASMKEIIDTFEAENPDINIDFSAPTGTANDYAQTLMTRISGNQTPDVFHMSVETRNEIIEAGLARDVTDARFMEGIDPTASEMYTKGGKVYGMAPTAWAGVIVYNKDLLKQAGYDSVPKDLDGFIQLGKDLLDEGITPYMEDTSVTSGSFNPMLGGYYAASGKTDQTIFEGKTTFESDWTPLIEQWQRLVTEGVLPPSTVGVGADQIKQSFMTGDLAMFRSGPWDFADLGTSGVDYGTAPFPAFEGGEPFIGGGPDSPYVLSSKIGGDKLAAAEKFLAFLNSDEGLTLAEKSLNQISTSAKHDSNVAPQLEDVYQDYVKRGKYYWINWPASGNVMGSEIAAQFQLLIQGQATPADVAKALDAKWSAQ